MAVRIYSGSQDIFILDPLRDAPHYFKHHNSLPFPARRDSVGLPPLGREPDNEDLSNLGTVIQETTRYLAQQYGLSRDAVASGLALIDTSKTTIAEYCPDDFLRTPQCKV